MVHPVEFVSIKGRVYTPKTVRPLVLSMIAKRYRGGILLPGWRQAVTSVLNDPEQINRCNGMCPVGIVNELEWIAVYHGRMPA